MHLFSYFDHNWSKGKTIIPVTETFLTNVKFKALAFDLYTVLVSYLDSRLIEGPFTKFGKFVLKKIFLNYMPYSWAKCVRLCPILFIFTVNWSAETSQIDFL